MEDIVLYTTHCPMCLMLERKLKEKNINYIEISNINEIKEAGIKNVPVLKVGNKTMDSYNAMQWIKNI